MLSVFSAPEYIVDCDFPVNDLMLCITLPLKLPVSLEKNEATSGSLVKNIPLAVPPSAPDPIFSISNSVNFLVEP